MPMWYHVRSRCRLPRNCWAGSGVGLGLGLDFRLRLRRRVREKVSRPLSRWTGSSVWPSGEVASYLTTKTSRSEITSEISSPPPAAPPPDRALPAAPDSPSTSRCACSMRAKRLSWLGSGSSQGAPSRAAAAWAGSQSARPPAQGSDWGWSLGQGQNQGQGQSRGWG
eukprot:scaffold16207_cov45-Phaeocystis_antarctica.AAC.1